MDPTKRFSNRVDTYIKYRPAYPEAIITFLEKKVGLHPDHEIADIGSGPGNSARLFAQYGTYVYGIEPNDAMYHALLRQMKDFSNFSARMQSAEDTDLDRKSIDFIVCAQSFHWFDKTKARTEFRRILKPEGQVILLWNSRRRDTEFGKAYEKLLLDYAIDYREVDHQRLDADDFDYFFNSWQREEFENEQELDFEGLKGRLLSSSYAPMPDHDNYSEMIAQLQQIFDTHQIAGKITFEYTTEVIYGPLST